MEKKTKIIIAISIIMQLVSIGISFFTTFWVWIIISIIMAFLLGILFIIGRFKDKEIGKLDKNIKGIEIKPITEEEFFEKAEKLIITQFMDNPRKENIVYKIAPKGTIGSENDIGLYSSNGFDEPNEWFLVAINLEKPRLKTVKKYNRIPTNDDIQNEMEEVAENPVKLEAEITSDVNFLGQQIPKTTIKQSKLRELKEAKEEEEERGVD